MIRQIDAIFSQGSFRPLEPVALPEGIRVHLSVEDGTSASSDSPVGRIRTPKLVHLEDASDFELEVREIDNAGI